VTPGRQAQTSSTLTGAAADRQAGDVQGCPPPPKDISEYSQQVQTAVTDAAAILKVGQSTNQQLIDDFMDRAAELLSARARCARQRPRRRAGQDLPS